MYEQPDKGSVAIDYQLIKSAKRKTLGLQVKSGKVIVRAPHNLSQASIDAFILEKQLWLKTKVNEQITYLNSAQTLTYLPDSFCLYQGDKKQIKLLFAKKHRLKSAPLLSPFI